MPTKEQIAARIAEQRAELMERAEMGRDELARRARAIRESFAENVHTDVVVNFAGWTLISTGIAWGVTGWMRGKRGAGALFLPIAMLVLGTSLLGGGAWWQRRSAHIGEAEIRVRAELEKLDPLARFRVLRDMAGETVPFVRNISVRN